MALIQVGTIAKRDPLTGQFGTALPICRELPTTQKDVDAKLDADITQILASKLGEYIQKTKGEKRNAVRDSGYKR